jgi:hypothetical protein
MIGGGLIALARAAIYAHDKADLRDLDVAGVRGSAAAAIVEMEGPPESLVHLPAAYLDEILLRDRKRDAEERLARMQARFVEKLERLDSQPESALGPINLFASIDDAEPYAHIETRLNATFRAATKCRPRRRLGDVLEAGFWAYWNWLLMQMELEPDAIRPLLANIQHQFEFYGVRGLHMRHIGEAVRHAMAAGAGERLRSERQEGEQERLWAARPAAEFMGRVYERFAEEERAQSETFVRSAEVSDATHLDLSGAETTDDDLARFPKMPQLEDLDLSGSSISDEGLIHLSECDLRMLDFLDLSNTAIRGPGFVHLGATPLSRLDLSGSEITDDGLRYLGGLERLEMLWLNGTAITDRAVPHLLSVASLEEVDVSDTAVTDAGLRRLLEHPRLVTAHARRTGATLETVEAWLDSERILTVESEEEEARTKARMDQEFADHLFGETAERFRHIYTSDSNPTVGNDLSIALEMMIAGFGYKNELADPASRDLWSLGSGGYAWRVAEGGGTGHANEEIRNAVAADFEPDNDRPYALMRAASGIVRRGAAIGLESPGGFLYGREFLRRGCEYVISFIADPAADVPREHQEAAFYVGVALHDVEGFVDELRASKDG